MRTERWGPRGGLGGEVKNRLGLVRLPDRCFRKNQCVPVVSSPFSVTNLDAAGQWERDLNFDPGCAEVRRDELGRGGSTVLRHRCGPTTLATHQTRLPG